MKGAIANVWFIGIMVTFIFLFSAYIIVTVEYSKSLKYKNVVLNIIEENSGMINNSAVQTKSSIVIPGKTVKNPKGTIQKINVYLAGSGYSAMGVCPTDDGYIWYGVDDLSTELTPSIKRAEKNKKYYYCFAKFKNSNKNTNYYKIRLYYKFQLPVAGFEAAFKIDGTTKDIYGVKDSGWEISR